MRVIDISGPIWAAGPDWSGMWGLSNQYPTYNLSSIEIESAGRKYSVDLFEGVHGKLGTYLEPPKFKKSEGYIDEHIEEGQFMSLNVNVQTEKLVMIDAYVLQIPYDKLSIKDGRPFISLEDIEKAESGKEKIPENSSILISTGYGEEYWVKEDYVNNSWFIKKDALYYLIDKKPFLIGGDSPLWENEVNPEGFFDRFYDAGIFRLAGCIRLEKIKKFRVKLTALHWTICGNGARPVHAIVIEE